MMGIAIGCVGMSYDDFMWLDYGEFKSIYSAWRRCREDQEQAEWERMRMLASICISPHVKHSPTPQKLLPFPWEKPRKKSVPVVGKDEAKARFEGLVERMAKK